MAFALPLLGAAAVPSLIGGAVGTVASALLSKKSGGSATQTATATTPTMPLADDAAVKRAKQRSVAAQLARGGRASTMLTSDGGGDKLG